jgi:hypothetical protein
MFLGLSLAFAPPKRGQIRQTTVGAIGAAIALAGLALVRPGAIHVWSIGTGVALALGWSYLVDCGNVWSALSLRQRAAAALFLAGAASTGLVAGCLVQQMAK